MEKYDILRLVFNSKKSGSIVIEEKLGEKEAGIQTIKTLNTSFSVDALPTAKIELNAIGRNTSLVGLKSGDEVTVYMGDSENTYEKEFHGLLASVEINSTKDTFGLTLDCVSGFYLLQGYRINNSTFNANNGLRRALIEIVRKCGINGSVEVSPSVADNLPHGTLNNFPALSFINALCYESDLVYDFDKGDVMTISKRSEILTRILSSSPRVIEDNEIISSKFRQ